MNQLRDLLRGAVEVVGPDLLAAVFRRMRRRMRKWDMQRVRSVAGSVAQGVVCFLLMAVFVLGLAWSASRHDERGPIAKVVAEVLAVVLALLGVAMTIVVVAIVIIGLQILLYGGDLLDWIILLGFAFCLLALLAFVAWFGLLVV